MAAGAMDGDFMVIRMDTGFHCLLRSASRSARHPRLGTAAASLGSR
jgi:hypothetical protein